MYDDIAYVIRNSKTNKWLKSFYENGDIWRESIVSAQLFDAKKANEYMAALQKTSHAKHVHIREIGVID